MKLTRALVVAFTLAATVVACDDDDDTTGITISDLAGTYAVQTFRYDADDGSASTDLATIPATQGGPLGITDMTVASDGSFSGTMKLPVQGSIQEFDVGGDIEITGDGTVRIDFDAATDALGVLDDFEDGTFDLDGNTLTLVLPDVSFDHTLSGGTPVASDLTIVATR